VGNVVWWVDEARGIESGSAADEVYHVLCLQRTFGSNKKSSLKTCRSPSSMSKYCITASTDKDEVVNEGENNGRTEMQSHDVLPLSGSLSRCPKMKPSCSRDATSASVSQLASTLPSSAPYYTAHITSLVPHISISRFPPAAILNIPWWRTDKIGEQGEHRTVHPTDSFRFVEAFTPIGFSNSSLEPSP
jgi:hypothetical protein